ncbi:hypothetical protein ABC977_17575 [Thioalkalicoccus limnaeus]|uniref:Uncharacterized protein n=1 Tax=Thioalkalicoccus limnaeus TaxID=120681 RepID=A0ABV4BI56_9GAMM
MNIRTYGDDAEILRLAEADRCATAVREALARGGDQTAGILAGPRIYLVHTAPGDSGFSCLEVGTPLQIPLVVAALAPIVGSLGAMQVRPHDQDPSAHWA